MEPTGPRAVASTEALPSTLSDTTAAEGRTVREFSHILNTGKRYKKLKSDGDTKKKPQKRDRKETLVLRPCHPGLQPALDKLLSGTVPGAATVQVSTLVSSRAARGDDPDVSDSGGDMSDGEVTFF